MVWIHKMQLFQLHALQYLLFNFGLATCIVNMYQGLKNCDGTVEPLPRRHLIMSQWCHNNIWLKWLGNNVVTTSDACWFDLYTGHTTFGLKKPLVTRVTFHSQLYPHRRLPQPDSPHCISNHAISNVAGYLEWSYMSWKKDLRYEDDVSPTSFFIKLSPSFIQTVSIKFQLNASY